MSTKNARKLRQYLIRPRELPMELVVGDICIRGIFDYLYYEEHHWSEYHYYRRRGLFGKEEVNEFEERIRRLVLRR